MIFLTVLFLSSFFFLQDFKNCFIFQTFHRQIKIWLQCLPLPFWVSPSRSCVIAASVSPQKRSITHNALFWFNSDPQEMLKYNLFFAIFLDAVKNVIQMRKWSFIAVSESKLVAIGDISSLEDNKPSLRPMPHQEAIHNPIKS
jgi:hypothetical protein